MSVNRPEPSNIVEFASIYWKNSSPRIANVMRVERGDTVLRTSYAAHHVTLCPAMVTGSTVCLPGPLCDTGFLRVSHDLPMKTGHPQFPGDALRCVVELGLYFFAVVFFFPLFQSAIVPASISSRRLAA